MELRAARAASLKKAKIGPDDDTAAWKFANALDKAGWTVTYPFRYDEEGKAKKGGWEIEFRGETDETDVTVEFTKVSKLKGSIASVLQLLKALSK